MTMHVLANRRQLTFVCLCIASFAPLAGASAFVRGGYYRLGEDDPGAVAGQIGNDPTRDSFADQLHLARIQSPRYSADVPPGGPFGSRLSMSFANSSLGGPGVPGYYGRTDSLEMVSGGFALEAWVNNAGDVFVGPGVDPLAPNRLVAYNGDPNANGFGLFVSNDRYVARIGGAGGVIQRDLGPADLLTWHHIAYIHSLGTSSYYYDGKLVGESTTDPVPLAASGGFWIGGNAHPLKDPGEHLFNGWIDEVRYQSFNPLAAGSFNPTNFLITPEPSAGTILVAAALLAIRRRAVLPRSL
jgi:hypothetical protein